MVRKDNIVCVGIMRTRVLCGHNNYFYFLHTSSLKQKYVRVRIG
jgi:hypothetical protein